jgi:hypothetical protein
VLNGLKQMYQSFWRKRAPRNLPHPRHVQEIDRIRDWDERVVAPRHGYDDAAHYYRDNSASTALEQIGVRTLLLHSSSDPMVPITTVRPFTSPLADRVGGGVEVRETAEGGHVGFPRSFSLGRPAPTGLEPQLLSWLRQP